MSTPDKLPSPEPNPETEAYWAGAREKKLLLKRCIACGETHHYPRALCPFCLGATEWVEAKGSGTIYSFSIMRRAAVPYVMAYVALDDGPIMMTNIVDHDLDDLHIGQRVALVFKEAGNGQPLPMFTPS